MLVVDGREVGNTGCSDYLRCSTDMVAWRALRYICIARIIIEWLESLLCPF
jgi:hypothetical protein